MDKVRVSAYFIIFIKKLMNMKLRKRSKWVRAVLSDYLGDIKIKLAIIK